MRKVLHMSLFILFVFSFSTVLNSQTSTELDVLKKQVLILEKTVSDLQGKMTTLQSAIQVTPGSVTIKTNGSMEIQSSGTMDIRGSILNLNGGGHPVARVGDLTTCQGGTGGCVGGPILQGSKSVFSN